ncbi:peptidylprolyl isomerase, partial [Candidatus Saccharibacteria bacterium]|nr:peptidylprolyl isomerase [Calditrichia bacterium]NIV71709.1 peptidylprolyl isomerase [Calditrichia bacterium]NIV98381.1 peptidylprolyl isomerase [Candidatus Saccharibacteria bacterium]NIW79340.1 peptidylprolyl isomerase [Calditrichia bacterium]
HGEKPQLDGEYTAFGEVTSGMGVVNEIANARTYGRQNRRLQNHPIDPIIIRRIEVYR